MEYRALVESTAQKLLEAIDQQNDSDLDVFKILLKQYFSLEDGN